MKGEHQARRRVGTLNSGLFRFGHIVAKRSEVRSKTEIEGHRSVPLRDYY